MIDVMLADSNPLVLSAMSEIFERDPRFSLVATSATAEGFLGTVMRVQVDVPVIVRLAGTNVEEGQKILAKSGLPIIRANTLMEAAERAVGAWKNDLSQATRIRAIT